MAYKRQFLVPDFLGVQIVKPSPRKSKVIFSNPNCKIVLLLWVTQGCALISPGHEWQLTFGCMAYHSCALVMIGNLKFFFQFM